MPEVPPLHPEAERSLDERSALLFSEFEKTPAPPPTQQQLRGSAAHLRTSAWAVMCANGPACRRQSLGEPPPPVRAVCRVRRD